MDRKEVDEVTCSVGRLANDVHAQLSLLTPACMSNARRLHAVDISAQLDSIGNTLARSLSQIWMLRNSQAAVHSLPPEVLTTIFRLVRGPRQLSRGQNAPRWSSLPSLRPNEWLPMTHVCRYWRVSALGDPLMWNVIEFLPSGDKYDEQSLAFEFLQRSAGAPLHVQIFCKGATNHNLIWQQLSSRCGRIRELRIVDLPSPEYLSYLNAEAPLLENLCIRVAYHLFHADVGADKLPMLFSGYTPLLRSLSLAYFTGLSWTCSNLTSLHLYAQKYPTLEDVSCLLGLLRSHCTTLKELSLEACDIYRWRENGTMYPSNDQDFILMPALQSLSFTLCSAKLISTVLPWLQIPGPKLIFTCHDWFAVDRHNDIFPPSAQSRIYPLREVTKLAITYERRALKAFSDTSAMILWFQTDPDARENIVRDIKSLLSFHALQEMWLSGPEEHPWEYWQEAFAAMPMLAKLVLQLVREDPSKWLDALSGDHSLDGLLPAPQLRKLVVFPLFPDAFPALSSMLEARAVRGHRVYELRILRSKDKADHAVCTAFDHWRDRSELSEFVDHVHFEDVNRYPCMDTPEAFQDILQ